MKRKLEAPVPTSTWVGDEASMRRAIAIAEKAEVSPRRRALHEAARSIADALGPDADAIDFVLEERYNPRCRPPWGAQALRSAAHFQATRLRWKQRAAASGQQKPTPTEMTLSFDDCSDPAVVETVEALGVRVVPPHSHADMTLTVGGCSDPAVIESAVELGAIMVTPPAWATGLPLAVTGAIMKRYRKT